MENLTNDNNLKNIKKGSLISLKTSAYEHYGLYSGDIGKVQLNCLSLFNAILASFDDDTFPDTRFYEIKAGDFDIVK